MDEKCKWHKEDGDLHVSGCGNSFYFEDWSTPLENDFSFCPFCGKPLEEIDLEDDEKYEDA